MIGSSHTVTGHSDQSPPLTFGRAVLPYALGQLPHATNLTSLPVCHSAYQGLLPSLVGLKLFCLNHSQSQASKCTGIDLVEGRPRGPPLVTPVSNAIRIYLIYSKEVTVRSSKRESKDSKVYRVCYFIMRGLLKISIL